MTLFQNCYLIHLYRENKNDIANKIEKALFKTIKEQKVLTPDLGGNATTTEYTNEIIKNM